MSRGVSRIFFGRGASIFLDIVSNDNRMGFQKIGERRAVWGQPFLGYPYENEDINLWIMGYVMGAPRGGESGVFKLFSKILYQLFSKFCLINS